MQIETNDEEKRWHGLTDGQWECAWALKPWRQIALDALLEIARCADALPEDRNGALATLNAAITNDLLPPLAIYAELVRDVLLAIAVTRERRWYQFGAARRRRACTARLYGVRALLTTASGFVVTKKSGGGVLSVPHGTLALDRLLS